MFGRATIRLGIGPHSSVLFIVAWWCNGYGVGSRRVQLPAVPLSDSDLGQVVHTHVPLSPSSIIWYQSRAATSCDWEGNRRSGVALAMCHRLKWFIHLRDQGLSKGDEHPTNTPDGIGVWYSLPFT